MATARVFKSGNSQAVRLPKDFRFRSKEVEIVTGAVRKSFFERNRKAWSELLSLLPIFRSTLMRWNECMMNRRKSGKICNQVPRYLLDTNTFAFMSAAVGRSSSA